MKIIKQYRHSLYIFEILISTLILVFNIFFLILLKEAPFIDNVQFLHENWNKKPIIDILALELGSSCPEDYENLLEIKYPGLDSGCDCKYPVKPSRQSCSVNQLYQGCKIINAKSPLTMTKYKNKTVCLKYYHESYSQQWTKLINSSQDCPLHMKKCGIIDSFSNILCDHESNCPITEMIFSNKTLPDSYLKKLILSEQTSISEYNDYYLYFSNQKFTGIISNIIFSGDPSKVCISKEVRNYQLFSDCYFTILNDNFQNCTMSDTIYGNFADSISGSQFYINNELSEYFSQTFYCNRYENLNRKFIYTSNYHGISLLCNTDNINEFFNIVAKRGTINGNLLGYLQIFQFLITIYYFIFCLAIKWYLLLIHDIKKLKTSFLLEMIMSCLLLITGISLFLQYIFLKDEVSYLFYFSENKCGDSYVNSIVDQIYNKAFNTLPVLRYSFILTIFSSLVYPIKVVYLYCALKKLEKINNGPNTPNSINQIHSDNDDKLIN